MKIQISLSSGRLDHLESALTMFTVESEVPRPIIQDLKKGYIVMVGMRPLMGNREVSGSSLYGRHWVSMDTDSSLFDGWLENNLSMQARRVMILSNEEQVGIALVNNKYANTYLKEDFEDRLEMLGSRIESLQGKSWKTLASLVDAAHKKGLV